MEPNRFGRKLGIGVRIASRMAKERAGKSSATSATQATTPRPPESRPATPPPPRPKKNFAEPARRVGEGTRRFGQAFFGPLKNVGGALWLEITGFFFALFAVFFGQNAWRLRAAALRGPEHAHFLLYSAVTLVFLYFSVSSFIKAAQRGRRTEGRRTAR
jgi:hypothetical protein